MNRNLTILIVEPDQNYVDLIKIALREIGIQNPTSVVSDGQEALDYLCARGKFQDRKRYPFPSVIFTETRLRRMGGLEVLKWLRDHPECSVIPVIILSASDQDSDIREAYHLGANSYVVKPSSLDELKNILQILRDYWSICAKPVMGEKC